MKLIDLLEVMSGKENIELHIDGLQLHFTSKNANNEWMAREIESVRIDPRIYLGLIVHINDE